MNSLRITPLFTFMILVALEGPTATSIKSEEFELEIPERCQRIGICEDVPNYPKEQAEKLISELSGLGMFPDDIVVQDVPDNARRVGSTEENIELCQSDKRIVYPQAAMDHNRKWHIVLNDHNNPIQTFQVDICKEQTIDDQQSKIKDWEWKDLNSCSDLVAFESGYQGRCKQKFMYRKMAVLTSDGNKLMKTLKVPTHCSCVARLV